jgi:hypothetical protein
MVLDLKETTSWNAGDTRYLEDKRGEEYEEILQEKRHARVHVGWVERLLGLVVEQDILAEQDPAGANQ